MSYSTFNNIYFSIGKRKFVDNSNLFENNKDNGMIISSPYLQLELFLFTN